VSGALCCAHPGSDGGGRLQFDVDTHGGETQIESQQCGKRGGRDVLPQARRGSSLLGAYTTGFDLCHWVPQPLHAAVDCRTHGGTEVSAPLCHGDD
jgi:hypothetical protein